MNKIESELSADDLKSFVEECYQTEGLTLAKIQALASDRGIEISLMGAKSFRDKNFSEHLRRLQRARELADQVEELGDSGKSLADASATIIAQQVFDTVASGGEDIDLNTLSKIIARLRTGDQRAKLLEMKVEEFERAKVRMKEAIDKARTKTTSGPSAELLDTMERELGFRPR